MVNIISSIFGEIEICISGENAEQFLNDTHKEKIPIKNLRCKNRSVIGQMRPADFKKLYHIRRKTGVKIKIISKRGLVFKLNKHSSRTGFIVGAVLFFVLLKTASLFVCGVEIHSNKPVNEAKIRSRLDGLGVKVGAFVKNIDSDITAQKLLLLSPELDWASVNKQGCVITVNLSRAENTQKAKIKSPSDLVAKTDGVITKIDVTSGETVVNIGDKVKKGDILVSGISSVGEETVFLNSSGKIYAKTEKTIIESGNLTQVQYKTEKIKKRSVLEVYGIKIPLYLGSIKKPYKTKTHKKTYSFLGKDLPVGKTQKVFYIKKKIKTMVSEDVLKQRLKDSAEKKIKDAKFTEYQITDESITQNKNTLTLKIKVSATENIAISENVK